MKIKRKKMKSIYRLAQVLVIQDLPEGLLCHMQQVKSFNKYKGCLPNSV